MSRTKFDGFAKSPPAALRFILGHCGMLLYTPHFSTCLLEAGIRAPYIWSFLHEKARMPRSEERVPTRTGGDVWPKWLFL